MQLIEGKKLADLVEAQLVQQIGKSGFQPGLAVVLVGDDPASKIYVNGKRKACERVGISSEIYERPTDISQQQLLNLIQTLNESPNIHGILIQLPLPVHIDTPSILAAVWPEKDVDGFHPINMGYLLAGAPRLVPCTPLGILRMLKHYEIPIEGKRAVVVGRSNIVGKPVAQLLLQQHATVTMCHSRTRDLASHTRSAEILVAAAGQCRFITGDMVSDGAVVIDVGMHRLADKKLAGDVDFDSVAPKTSYITPVPKGVGPMTIAMLLQNTFQAAQRKYKERSTRDE